MDFLNQLILSTKNLFLLGLNDPISLILSYPIPILIIIISTISVLFNTRNQHILQRFIALFKNILFLIAIRVAVLLAEYLNS